MHTSPLYKLEPFYPSPRCLPVSPNISQRPILLQSAGVRLVLKCSASLRVVWHLRLPTPLDALKPYVVSFASFRPGSIFLPDALDAKMPTQLATREALRFSHCMYTRACAGGTHGQSSRPGQSPSSGRLRPGLVCLLSINQLKRESPRQTAFQNEPLKHKLFWEQHFMCCLDSSYGDRQKLP
ncbi:unnamed protein product [Protopolystoma xenopodis]|uniref:Uncharacterized protein n=1 Tax=Protopolystoma xenopodis TaxID=117903 RepID=A0A448XLI0_9PLAT|nr:unnamed protein product [Protopolystoma xenopodis]